MSASGLPPKEDNLYKVVTVDRFTFELRFGYYADFERENGEPVVLYPDLTAQKLYTAQGKRLVTAIQDPCPHYRSPQGSAPEGCCDCVYFSQPGDEIGVCTFDEASIL